MFSLPQLKTLFSTLNIKCCLFQVFLTLNFESASVYLHQKVLFCCSWRWPASPWLVVSSVSLNFVVLGTVFQTWIVEWQGSVTVGQRRCNASCKIFCQITCRVKGISFIWYCNTTSPLKILLSFSSTQTVCRWCQFLAIKTISRCVIRRLLCKAQVLIR